MSLASSAYAALPMLLGIGLPCTYCQSVCKAWLFSKATIPGNISNCGNAVSTITTAGLPAKGNALMLHEKS